MHWYYVFLPSVIALSGGLAYTTLQKRVGKRRRHNLGYASDANALKSADAIEILIVLTKPASWSIFSVAKSIAIRLDQTCPCFILQLQIGAVKYDNIGTVLKSMTEVNTVRPLRLLHRGRLCLLNLTFETGIYESSDGTIVICTTELDEITHKQLLKLKANNDEAVIVRLTHLYTDPSE